MFRAFRICLEGPSNQLGGLPTLMFCIWIIQHLRLVYILGVLPTLCHPDPLHDPVISCEDRGNCSFDAPSFGDASDNLPTFLRALEDVVGLFSASFTMIRACYAKAHGHVGPCPLESILIAELYASVFIFSTRLRTKVCMFFIPIAHMQ